MGPWPRGLPYISFGLLAPEWWAMFPVLLADTLHKKGARCLFVHFKAIFLLLRQLYHSPPPLHTHTHQVTFSNAWRLFLVVTTGSRGKQLASDRTALTRRITPPKMHIVPRLRNLTISETPHSTSLQPPRLSRNHYNDLPHLPLSPSPFTSVSERPIFIVIHDFQA